MQTEKDSLSNTALFVFVDAPNTEQQGRIGICSMVFSIFCMIALLSPGWAKSQTYQRFTLDSALTGYSEQMGIANNGRAEGVKLAIMGPYVTNFADKLDSGAFRTKVKENKEMIYSGSDGFEEFKIKKIEQHAFYRMGLSRESDTVTTFFSLYSSVRKKSETVLSVILSKKEENTNSEYFDNSKEVGGYISIKNDSSLWHFRIYYPESSGSGVNNHVSGYLANGIDSFNINLVYGDVVKRSKKEPFVERTVMRTSRGYTLIDQDNRQMAALIFRQSTAYIGAQKLGNFTGGEWVILGKENSKETRLAMASLFSIMIGIHNL